MRVLIVGAGPTGLTTAVELARRGIAPTIIDRRAASSTLSRAVGITPRSLQALSESGVAERLIDAGVAMDSARIYRGKQLALQLRLHSDRAYFPTILGLPQDQTETIMADVLAGMGEAVRYGVALEQLQDTGAEVIAQLSDGTEQAFDVVVGADGIGSTVRQAANIDYPGFDLEETWSIADVHADDWAHDSSLTLIQVEPGIVMVVVPMAESRYRLVASHPDVLKVLPLPLNVTRINREGTFTISVRQAETYSKGRIHLAGDAAHCHSPVGGRGMNLGIADAAELARCIAADDLGNYSPHRHHEGADTIAATERARAMVSGRGWSRRFVFGSMLRMASMIPPLQQRLGRLLV